MQPFRAMTGGGLGVVQLIASDYTVTEEGTGSSTCTFTLSAAGIASSPGIVGSGSNNYAWRTGGSSASYEVVVSLVAGTFTSGVVGTGALVAGQIWTVNKVGTGTKSCTASFTIRIAGGGAIVAGPVNIGITAICTA